MAESVKAYERLSDNPIRFSSCQQFNEYYMENKETIDKMATRGVNRHYLIDGYKVTRRAGEIVLVPTQDNTITMHTIHNKLREIDEKIDLLLMKDV